MCKQTQIDNDRLLPCLFPDHKLLFIRSLTTRRKIMVIWLLNQRGENQRRQSQGEEKKHDRKQRQPKCVLLQQVCTSSWLVLCCRSDQTLHTLTLLIHSNRKIGKCSHGLSASKDQQTATQTFFVFAISLLISCKSMTTNRMSG